MKTKLFYLLLLFIPVRVFAGDIIRGGDISMLTMVEDSGGVFYDVRHNQRECLSLLAENGFNTVRLRLYNDPGNPEYSPSNRLPAGYLCEDDVLRLALRAKEAGMQIVLSFHYSDYWTNGETQTIPHAWQDLTFTPLCDSVKAYTTYFLRRMQAQGTLPEYVSLGNETQAGMLYPLGSCQNMSRLAKLYGAAIAGVHAVSTDVKTILHLATDMNDIEANFRWHFGELRKLDVMPDIIGASYYPFWTGRTIEQISDFATAISTEFQRPVLLMEVGYAWQATLPDGSNGQLSHNQPYEQCTKLGQQTFIRKLVKACIANESLMGFLYWDPIFIPAGQAGWELGAKNVVANSALFDFNGVALAALSAFKTDLPDGIDQPKALNPNPSSLIPQPSPETYDLAGRRIDGSMLKSGLYIVNGHKVIK